MALQGHLPTIKMGKKTQDKQITLRILDSAFLDRCWQDAEKIYGKKATEKLRSVAPADPLLLRDMAIFSYMTDGKTKKEAKALIDGYTHDEWAYDMERFAKTINKVKKLYTKNELKGYNVFTSDI